MENYILGFGLSGAMASHYLTDYHIITPIVPIKSRYPPGPLYLYYNDLTKVFVEELGFEANTRKVRQGFFSYKNMKVNPPTEEVLIRYYQWTRETRNMPPKEWIDHHVQEFFTIIDIELDDLIERLWNNAKDRAIYGYVDILDLEMQMLHLNTDHLFEYDNVVSTIPAPHLTKLVLDENMWISNRFKWRDIFCGLWSEPIGWQNQEYDFVYYLSSNPYRITKLQKYEYIVEGFSPPSMARDARVFHFGKICSGQALDLTKNNVFALGRFAQWKQNLKMHDVLKRIQLYTSCHCITTTQKITGDD